MFALLFAAIAALDFIVGATSSGIAAVLWFIAGGINLCTAAACYSMDSRRRLP